MILHFSWKMHFLWCFWQLENELSLLMSTLVIFVFLFSSCPSVLDGPLTTGAWTSPFRCWGLFLLTQALLLWLCVPPTSRVSLTLLFCISTSSKDTAQISWAWRYIPGVKTVEFASICWGLQGTDSVLAGSLCSVKADGIYCGLLQMAMEWTGEGHMNIMPWEVEQRVGQWNASHLDVSAAVVGQLKVNGSCWDSKEFLLSELA